MSAPILIRHEPDSAPPTVRRFADGKAGALKRMAERNRRDLARQRRSRCFWGAACPGEPVEQQYRHWTRDGWEEEPFSVCAEHEAALRGRQDYCACGGAA